MTAATYSARSPKLSQGDRIRVTQTIVGRNLCWTTAIEGVVESYGPEPTGSWFAHSKNGRLWLPRIRLRKNDGEITTLALDSRSRIEILAC